MSHLKESAVCRFCRDQEREELRSVFRRERQVLVTLAIVLEKNNVLGWWRGKLGCCELRNKWVVRD